MQLDQEYVDLLLSNGFVGSMSRKGNPYDNAAQAESFMKTLKYEEVHLFEYNNIVEAEKRIRFFIEDGLQPEKITFFIELPSTGRI